MRLDGELLAARAAGDGYDEHAVPIAPRAAAAPRRPRPTRWTARRRASRAHCVEYFCPTQRRGLVRRDVRLLQRGGRLRRVRRSERAADGSPTAPTVSPTLAPTAHEHEDGGSTFAPTLSPTHSPTYHAHDDTSSSYDDPASSYDDPTYDTGDDTSSSYDDPTYDTGDDGYVGGDDGYVGGDDGYVGGDDGYVSGGDGRRRLVDANAGALDALFDHLADRRWLTTYSMEYTSAPSASPWSAPSASTLEYEVSGGGAIVVELATHFSGAVGLELVATANETSLAASLGVADSDAMSNQTVVALAGRVRAVADAPRLRVAARGVRRGRPAALNDRAASPTRPPTRSL